MNRKVDGSMVWYVFVRCFFLLSLSPSVLLPVSLAKTLSPHANMLTIFLIYSSRGRPESLSTPAAAD
jgi:hypothetical protein